jgi:hypothetical protein
VEISSLWGMSIIAAVEEKVKWRRILVHAKQTRKFVLAFKRAWPWQ